MRKYGNFPFCAIAYLVLPILIFFLTWLKVYIGVPCAILLLYGTYKFYTDIAIDNIQNSKWQWSKECLIAVILIFVYLLFTGHGSFVGAVGFDVPWRNAMYQDLIHQSWPVIYQNSQSALVYYLAYWLVPAGISFALNLDVLGSNVVMFVWTFLGLLIFVGNLWEYLQVQSKKMIYVVLVFLFWSGINTIGMFIMQFLSSNRMVEFTIGFGWGWEYWWYTGIKYSNYYMIRTVFDSLANIYNQFVPLLLGTILFLRFNVKSNTFFIALLTLPYSPFGFIGLGFLAFGEAVWSLIKKHDIRRGIKDIFSVQNFLALIAILPVFTLYFFSNSMSGNTGGSITKITTTSAYNYFILKVFILVLYYILQFGIFMVLCYKNNKGRSLYWFILFSLLLFPLIKIGNSSDFGWNASIPAFFILMIMAMQELLRLSNSSKQLQKQGLALIVIVCLAATTPILQIGYGVQKCLKYNAPMVSYFHDGLESTTFSDKNKEQIAKDYKNFANINYRDKVFYEYLAKNN